MKSILVITGSSRKDGNSTLLAKAFIEGAEHTGNKIMLFDVAKKKVNPCIACNTCLTKGRCVYNDDFNELIPMLQNADIIVFSSPLYWFTFSAQLKAVIDRMYSVQNISNKQSVLITCGQTDNMNDFEGIIKSYELMANYLEWKNIAVLAIPDVNEVGDVKNTDGLEKAKKIGLSIKD